MDKIYKAFCALSNTPRFNTTRLLAPYSVADHTTRVIYLAMRLADEFPIPGVNIELVMKGALFHDIEEAEFGDIKTPAKKYLKDYDEASEQVLEMELQMPSHYIDAWAESRGSTVEADIIKLADMVEAFITSAYELERGNTSLRDCYNQLNMLLQKQSDTITRYYPYAKHLIEKARADVKTQGL